MVIKVLKKIFLIFFISFNIHSEIIYNKNGISITSIELKNYHDIYYKNYKKTLNNNQAIKNLFVVKKLINFYMVNNPDVIKVIDSQIDSNQNIVNELERDFLRFMSIKNEFIINYFVNKFTISDLKIIFLNLEELNLPISKNNCMTIDDTKDLKNDNFFLENLYTNLKNNTNNFTTQNESAVYNVCLNQIEFKKIERLIIEYIEKVSKDDFDDFLYSKIY